MYSQCIWLLLVLPYYVQMKSLLCNQNKSMMVACLISFSAPGNVSSLRTEERRGGSCPLLSQETSAQPTTRTFCAALSTNQEGVS